MKAFKRLAPVLAATTVLTAGVVPFGAGEPSTGVAMAAEAPVASVPTDKAILPYLDEATFIVARLDVEKVDHDELQKMMERMLESMFKKMGVPAAQLPQVKAQAMQSSGQAKQWLTDMGQAGGKHVYILMDTDVGAAAPPSIVVPFENAEDASKIQGVLTRNGGQEQAAEAGKAVVYARPEQVEKLQKRVAANATPVSRPDLAKAFADAGDSPLRFAYVPSESARKWIEEKAPTLPAMLGGGDSKVLSRGVKYASISMVQKPASMAKFKVHCTDAEQAKKLAETLTKGADAAKDQLGGDEGLQKSLEAAKPKVAGDTVSFDVDPVAVQLGLSGLSVRSEVEVDDKDKDAPAKPGEPPKNDDGL
jgi:hypothetical protein